MAKQIALIHTSPSMIPVFKGLAGELLPSVGVNVFIDGFEANSRDQRTISISGLDKTNDGVERNEASAGIEAVGKQLVVQQIDEVLELGKSGGLGGGD